MFWEYIPNIKKAHEKSKSYFKSLYDHYNDEKSINESYFGKEKK